VDVAALTYRHRMRSRGEVSPGSRHAVVAGVAVAVALVALALLFALGLWLWGPIGSAADSSEEPGAGSGGDAVATSAPVFATDEEALAAATEAYARYLAVSDAIAEDGGAYSERITPVVAETYRNSSIEDFAALSERELRTVGVSAFDTARLQSRVGRNDGSTAVTIYLCLDVSGVRIVDRGGADVTPSARDTRLPLEIQLETTVLEPAVLKVSRSEIWSGESFC
jgi:hypothetical protein